MTTTIQNNAHTSSAKQKRQVLYAIQALDSGAAMRAPYLILKGFAASGWEARVITVADARNTGIASLWESVPVQYVTGTSRKLQLVSLAQKIFARPPHQIVISFVWDWHGFALAAARILRNKPYAIALDTYIHQSPAENQNRLARWRRELRFGFVLRHANIIFAETPIAYEYAQRAFRQSDVMLVPFCLWRRELEQIETAWAQNPLSTRAPVILYAGRLVERKRVHDLIEAFSRLAHEFPDWRLELRALAAQDAYLERIRKAIREKNLDARVQLAPPLSSADLYRRYAETGIVALPSEGEGLPTAITEAMYFNGAIVAGRSGFVPYQLDKGGCGLLHTPGDVDALTAHLRTFMASPETREVFRERARARMLNLFTWETYFPAIESKFRALVQDDKPA